MKRNAMSHLSLAAVTAAMFVIGTPMNASENDSKIESSFEKTYVYKTYLKDDAIKTEMKDGIFTLTGTVSEESHKILAQETAAGLPGVTGVENKLTTEAEAAAESADKWIGRKVKLTLLFHRNVNAGGTEVDVKNGVVTLTGEATSIAQKELTSEYAGDIDGVKEVKNRMTVAATEKTEERTSAEKIDDASVTAQVKTALMTHRSTSAVNTKVITRNGEVTLTGIAKNDAEKSLVSKLVADIQGVTGVDNRMTIEVPQTK
jgi:osmotically-inducible protein OsmY